SSLSDLALKKIGIYGGTFDPIHHGHLILAREAVETLGLDKLIFVPARVSPDKQRAPFASPETRLSMLQAAIAGESQFDANDCELRRAAPSYTIETIEQIRQREGDCELYCCVGEDNVPALPNWHRFDELKNMVRFVVLDRSGTESVHGYQVVQRKIDISATEIRKRVASRRSIRYLVPREVEEIIHRHNLYREALQ
ncbi:MAG TPA: nicotinate-nucleotide adenylyltransferase, partial [Chthoniobacterales bacterium]|nr:nicotinate-nucleotide adenylyltransferase [Chthoniobacterales bacterium]